MPRRFTDARELLSDLLNRHEGGTESPIAYLNDSGFADVSDMDRFVKELLEAEAAGAIRVAKGGGGGRGQIRHVGLGGAPRLFEVLGRRPGGGPSAEADSRMAVGVRPAQEFAT